MTQQPARLPIEALAGLIAKSMSEREFQDHVVTHARQLGWTDFHQFDSRRSREGWPDLVLARERLVYAELKSQAGVVSPHQKATHELLRRAGAELYVWRPSDWEKIQDILR